MKYIKLFENYQNIDDICNKYYIRNYTINDNGLVDVDGDVSLVNKEFNKLPLKFGKVSDGFNCGGSNLTSLEGCPQHVGGSLNCGSNKLTTLKYSPITVDRIYQCSNNNLISLEGCTKYIGGSFNCNINKLTTLKYFPEVNEFIDVLDNPLPKEIYDNIKYLRDIIKNQYSYGIWNKDDTLNLPRFGIMIEEIKG